MEVVRNTEAGTETERDETLRRGWLEDMLQGGVSLRKHLKATCPEHQRLWVWAWSTLPKSDAWAGGGRQRGGRQLGKHPNYT